MRRILYVDRDLRSRVTEILAEGLRELGEVCLMQSLSHEVIEAVRRALDDRRPFDAVVSHLPQANAPLRYQGITGFAGSIALKNAVYGPAFSLLGDIKEVADIPVTIYTGACQKDIPAVAWELSGADTIRHKGEDSAEDARHLVETIRNAWSEYAVLPPATEARCETDSASAWIETLVRLNWGVGMAAGARVAKILRGAEWRAERINADGPMANAVCANDIMGMLCMEAVCGSRLRIRMNDRTLEGQDALCRAHRLLNARYL